MTWLKTWLKAWRERRRCFHHDWRTGTSWIEDQIVDAGRAKHFWCTRCRRYWT